MKLANNMNEATVAETASDGAIYQTFFHLLATGEPHWAAPGRYRLVVGDAVVQVSIENLAGRINPNTATPESLRELLLALGVNASDAAALGTAIVTWRTPAERPSRPNRRRPLSSAAF